MDNTLHIILTVGYLKSFYFISEGYSLIGFDNRYVKRQTFNVTCLPAGSRQAGEKRYRTI